MGKMTHGASDPKFWRKISEIHTPSTFPQKNLRNLTHGPVGIEQERNRHSNLRHTLRHKNAYFLTHTLEVVSDISDLSVCQSCTALQQFSINLSLGNFSAFYYIFPQLNFELQTPKKIYSFPKVAARALWFYSFTFKTVQL